jgi:hypothetical protein
LASVMPDAIRARMASKRVAARDTKINAQVMKTARPAV